MDFFSNFSLEAIDFRKIFTITMTLFALIDIVGSIPILIDLKKKAGVIESFKAACVSLVLMVAFLFVGNQLLGLVGVDTNAFGIAGAFVLFVIGVEMILGIELHKSTEMKAASIVPIAFPLIAGTGTLTTIIALKTRYNDINILIGIIINILIVYFVLKNVDWLERKIGNNTMQILKKVFGIIVLAASVKLFTENGVELIKQLNIKK